MMNLRLGKAFPTVKSSQFPAIYIWNEKEAKEAVERAAEIYNEIIPRLILDGIAEKELVRTWTNRHLVKIKNKNQINSHP